MAKKKISKKISEEKKLFIPHLKCVEVECEDCKSHTSDVSNMAHCGKWKQEEKPKPEIVDIDISKLTKLKWKKIEIDKIVTTKECWCQRPYIRHPKGCPNYGKNELCPGDDKEIPKFEDMKDGYQFFYLLYAKFDFKTYLELMKKKFPDWSENKRKTNIYYQKSIQKLLKDKIKELMIKNPPFFIIFCGSGLKDAKINRRQQKVYSMEAMGINVFSTCKWNKIKLERKPEKIIRLCCLLCSNYKIMNEKWIQIRFDYVKSGKGK